MNAQHSAASAEWYTPGVIVEAARKVLGRIDVDPASSHTANEVVKAEHYIDKETDGVAHSWLRGNGPISVFLNPPGGKYAGSTFRPDAKGKPMPKLFWELLMGYRTCGDLTHAIFVCYSLEQLQSFQSLKCSHPLDFQICVPNRRLKFVGAGGSPTHANAIVYVDGREDHQVDFCEAFRDIGDVR